MPSHYPTDDSKIPDSPEELFEQLAEPTLRELFPTFDELRPVSQKLVRLLHTELTKGELNDGCFQGLVGLLLTLWRRFNGIAMERLDETIATEDDLEEDWITSATAFHRTDQFLAGMLILLETMPEDTPEDEDSIPMGTAYRINHQS